VNVLNCKPEILFLALAHIEHEISLTYLQGEDGKEIPLLTIANLSEYYTLKGAFNLHSKAQFSMNNRDQWKELGIDPKYLYHEPPFEGPDALMEQMKMSGLPIDIRSRHGKLICTQMQEFPKALIDQSQDIIMEVIDRHLLFSDVPPHPKGQMWAVEINQRIKVQL
jgi:hypothetical protein